MYRNPYRSPWFGGTRSRRVAVAALFFLAVSCIPGSAGAAEEEPASPTLPILLLNGSIYPESYDPASIPKAFRIDGYPEDEAALYILHCREPVKAMWLQELRGLGAEPRGYLAYNSLVVGMDGDSHSRLRELDCVDWSGVLQPYFKVSPPLQLQLAMGGEVTVLAQLWSPSLLDATLGELSSMPVEVLSAQPDAWGALISMRLAVEDLAAVAALPAVEWMELSTTGSFAAAFPDPAWKQGRGGGESAYASGGEETVALADTGIGTGWPQGVPSGLRGMLRSLYSCRGDNGEDVNGHGTAVAGVLAGALRAETEAGAQPASLIVYATGYGLENPPRPLSFYSVLESAYGQGARVFLSTSVPEGRLSLGCYGIHAAQRDAFAWNNREMVVVEAAGNEGTDADGDGKVDGGSLLGGATAKNVISMGGSESPQAPSAATAPLTYGELQAFFSGSFSSSPLAGDSSVGAESGMAAFSSRGPTGDGRIKPDLVAPCTCIPSLASGGPQAAPGVIPSGNGEEVVCYGTSMAAASAAACLSVLRQQMAGRLGEEPSSALLKALLVNGAEDLAPGQYGGEREEVPAAPNAVEGWGRLDGEASMREETWVKVLDEKEGMRLGDTRAYRLEVPSGKELRVTLAWCDFPSLPGARLHLVNDLDLRVVDSEGNSYYPNGRSSRDPLNNVERVAIGIADRPGDYTVELSAWNVPFSPQPFALVVQVF